MLWRAISRSRASGISRHRSTSTHFVSVEAGNGGKFCSSQSSRATMSIRAKSHSFHQAVGGNQVGIDPPGIRDDPAHSQRRLLSSRLPAGWNRDALFAEPRLPVSSSDLPIQSAVGFYTISTHPKRLKCLKRSLQSRKSQRPPRSETWSPIRTCLFRRQNTRKSGFFT